MKASNGILTADNDRREYKIITLPNQLEAILIRDCAASKACVALDVNVGSNADPIDAPGVAHLCEHLLFLGNKKYPSANEYSQYLSDHGGYGNAATDRESTFFYFDVANDHLEGAMDRFAHFFKSPLFSNEYTEREVSIVQSEHERNVKNDPMRFNQVEFGAVNPEHPYRKFATGTSESLKGARSKVIDLYNSYYSSNLMKLVVCGQDSLETLESIARDKFSILENKNVRSPHHHYSCPPLTKEELGTVIKIKSIMDANWLKLIFPIPNQQRDFFETKPVRYFCQILERHCSNSLIDHLKRFRWANNVYAGSFHVSGDWDFFNITVPLTANGLQNYEKVVSLVFEYLNAVSFPLNNWLLEEMKQTSQMEFNHKSSSLGVGDVLALARNMKKGYIPRKYLLARDIILNCDADHVHTLAAYLVPSNTRILLTSNSFTGLAKTEKWYGVEYDIAPFSISLNHALEHVKESQLTFSIGEPNTFIPVNFDIICKNGGETVQNCPKEIMKDDVITVYHRLQSESFSQSPKVNIFMRLRFPQLFATVKDAVLTELVIDLVSNKLAAVEHAARDAGFDCRFELKPELEAIEIGVSGFSDKAPIVLHRIVTCFKKYTVDNDDQFEDIKNLLFKSYANFEQKRPELQIPLIFKTLLKPGCWNIESKKNVSVESADVKEYLDKFIHRPIECAVDMMVIGNMSPESTMTVANDCLSIIDPVVLSKSANTAKFDLSMLSQGKQYIYTKKLTSNSSSCLGYFLHINQTNRLVAELFARIVHEPIKEQLRIKEQLGYGLFRGIVTIPPGGGAGQHWYRVLIQSQKDVKFLRDRVRTLIEKLVESVIPGVLADKDTFQSHIAALRAKKLAPKTSVDDEARHFWSLVDTEGFADFARDTKDAETLSSITPEQVLEFAFCLAEHPTISLELEG